MRVAEDRARWRDIVEAYVQQWTDDDDDLSNVKLIPFTDKQGAQWPRGYVPDVIAEVKQRWSVIGWVTENLLPRAPRFGMHLKLAPTNPHWAKWWITARSPYV
jgi:hypothetical protein